VPFPNYEHKHTQVRTPLVTPERTVEHLRQQGRLAGYVPPEGVIFLYQRDFAQMFLAREAHRPFGPYPGLTFSLERTAGKVAVAAFFGIGAPAVHAPMEVMGALGTRRFLSLGVAGGLQPDGRIGDLVVCDAAVRDEGVSHHYLPPARLAHPSVALTEQLKRGLQQRGLAFKVGPTWTIDAPFCETVEELRHYRDDGVLTVEMEAAALFAVAEHRGFEIASAFVLSDTLREAEWTPAFGSPEVNSALGKLVDTGIELLSQ
jgi:uridine phosphorylase